MGRRRAARRRAKSSDGEDRRQPVFPFPLGSLGYPLGCCWGRTPYFTGLAGVAGVAGVRRPLPWGKAYFPPASRPHAPHFGNICEFPDIITKSTPATPATPADPLFHWAKSRWGRKRYPSDPSRIANRGRHHTDPARPRRHVEHHSGEAPCRSGQDRRQAARPL